ncbi:hyaluronidase [Plakobranchus ocellatus]|uniref:Hyaluronidase n=1 Tax=Plakobranchus ocellatus TaxID=259542 RepID=A0AAV3XZ89_9GAST|nr:hyaluronidase [Plakobranchus ocellatus]
MVRAMFILSRSFYKRVQYALMGITSILVSSSTASILSNQPRSHSCTAPSLLPEKPFVVVWNHPSQVCERHGVHVDFKKWGILSNKDSFIGEIVSLLYGPGKWPYYQDNYSYNGGLPQLGNETFHLKSLEGVLDSEVPNLSFSGLGVIDFEKWRPLFSLNFDSLKIYQEKSLELAKQRHPDYNSSQVAEEAVREFEKSARAYIEDSLRVATTQRPHGQWGYYGYPRCWDEQCNTSTVINNDRMSWVFAASSALYPSIYFDLDTPPAARARKVTKTLLETLRVKAKWAGTDAAIFPYALNQDGPYTFFKSSDLDYSIRQPADLGSSGILLWGSSATARAKDECLLLQDYVNSTLGPFSKLVMDFFSNCSAQLCSSHGRCVRKDYEAVYQHHLSTTEHERCKMPQSSLVISLKRKQPISENFTVLLKSLQDRNAHEREGFSSLKPERVAQKIDVIDRMLRSRASHGERSAEADNGFDDYVCKCLAGWSGPHCDREDIE